MEYVNGRGYYRDLPLAEIRATFKEHYGVIMEPKAGKFDEDVDLEHTIQS